MLSKWWHLSIETLRKRVKEGNVPFKPFNSIFRGCESPYFTDEETGEISYPESYSSIAVKLGSSGLASCPPSYGSSKSQHHFCELQLTSPSLNSRPCPSSWRTCRGHDPQIRVYLSRGAAQQMWQTNV